MLVYNEDWGHFFNSYRDDEMNEQGLRNWVNLFADTQITDLVLNANGQRCCFDSHAREALWHGYDPENPEDPSFFSKRENHWNIIGHKEHVRHAYMLYAQGIDPYAVWLDQCKKVGINGYISMRMNDVHGVSDDTYFLHNSFWREHPQARCAEYRWSEGRTGDWEDRQLDYALPQVRALNMALVEEYLERYGDLHGLELDWMRFPFNFRPGFEEQGIEMLNEFIREVSQKCRARNVKLAVRVPVSAENALALGLDVYTWAHQGWIDRVITSPSIIAVCNQPIGMWRRLLAGTSVELLACCEGYVRHNDETAEIRGRASVASMRGTAASLWHLKPDGLYLFNHFNRRHNITEEEHAGLLREVGNIDTLRGKYRRHIVSSDYLATSGLETILNTLPMKVGNRWKDVNLNLGATKGESLRVLVDQKIQVRMNGVPCEYNGEVNFTATPHPGHILYAYLVPDSVAHDGGNNIDLLSEKGEVTVEWIEVEANGQF